MIPDKTISDKEDDIRVLFSSVLNRINEKLGEDERIVVLDRELGAAVETYVKAHPQDVIIWGDD